MRSALTLCALAGLLTAGCGGKSLGKPRSATATGGNAAQIRVSSQPPVRGCDASVTGPLGPGWRSSPLTVHVGAVAFPSIRSYRSAPRNDFQTARSGPPRQYQGQKALLVVGGGATVTLTIPPSERSKVSLLYSAGTPAQLRYSISQGTTSVRFKACPDHSTQFNGGFIVAGPRCVAIKVREDARPGTAHGWIPFGTQRQPCPAAPGAAREP